MKFERNSPHILTIKNFPNLVKVLSFTLKLKSLFNVNELKMPKPYAIELVIT